MRGAGVLHPEEPGRRHWHWRRGGILAKPLARVRLGRVQVPGLGRLGKSGPFMGCSVSASSSTRAAKRLGPNWTGAGRFRVPLLGRTSSSRRLVASVKSQISSADAGGGDVNEASEGCLDPLSSREWAPFPGPLPPRCWRCSGGSLGQSAIRWPTSLQLKQRPVNGPFRLPPCPPPLPPSPCPPPPPLYGGPRGWPFPLRLSKRRARE